jgi:DNA-binding transcriptional ArsR family regulator
VNESGLSRHAVRTWQGLTEAGSGGAEVAELTAAVGFQRSTVLGHLKGLAELGLAEDRGSVWAANVPVEDPSARDGVRVPAGISS